MLALSLPVSVHKFSRKFFTACPSEAEARCADVVRAHACPAWSPCCRVQVDRLMDMIVNSLYSNRDVFLRELISNGSDALDKIRFMGLSDTSALRAGSDLEIRVRADPVAKTITIECVPRINEA